MDHYSIAMAQKHAVRLRLSQKKWAMMPIKSRMVHISRIATLLSRRKKEYSIAMAKEMGKPVIIGEQEIEKCISLCDYCVHFAAKSLENEKGKTHHGDAIITYEPLGLILGISAWNNPFWSALRFALPTLCAGNTVIIKHSSTSKNCARLVEKLMADSGLADYAKVILAKHEVVEQMISKRLVDGVMVIGDISTGASIASNAAKSIIPQVLHLSGSDAFIVMEDSDIRKAATELVASRMLNSGQNSESAKRAIVHKKIAVEFEQAVIDELSKLRIGDPLEATTAIGPLVSEAACSRIEEIVSEAREKGARLAYGGHRLNRKGNYFMPTILADCTFDMKLLKEEVFGPILPIVTFDSDLQAVDIANHSKYGLGASIWTRSKDRAHRMAQKLEVGTVCINKRVRQDIMLPFGGIKASGYGRDLGALGFRAFVNVKTISS